MLITRRSRRARAEGWFGSRPGQSALPPVRRFRACRELLVGALLHCAVLAALLCALACFTSTVIGLFRRHGSGNSPGLAAGAVVLLVLTLVWLTWRLIGRLRDVRQLRREIQDLSRQLRDLETGPEA